MSPQPPPHRRRSPPLGPHRRRHLPNFFSPLPYSPHPDSSRIPPVTTQKVGGQRLHFYAPATCCWERRRYIYERDVLLGEQTLDLHVPEGIDRWRGRGSDGEPVEVDEQEAHAAAADPASPGRPAYGGEAMPRSRRRPPPCTRSVLLIQVEGS